jgi:DNA-binding transcriptional ArsR family regulator
MWQDGSGKNMLGQILVEVRTLLRRYVEVQKIARALSSRDRLRFLHHLLLEGEMSTIELVKTLTMPESTLFTHARVLIDAGMITLSKRRNSEGKGKMNYYKIKEIPELIQDFSTLDLPGRNETC